MKKKIVNKMLLWFYICVDVITIRFGEKIVSILLQSRKNGTFPPTFPFIFHFICLLFSFHDRNETFLLNGCYHAYKRCE